MLKVMLGILLLVSAIFVFYPMISGLVALDNSINALNQYYANSNDALNSARGNSTLQLFGFILLYLFAGAVIVWLPDDSIQNTIVDRKHRKNQPKKENICEIAKNQLIKKNSAEMMVFVMIVGTMQR